MIIGISILFLIISAIFNSEMDTIALYQRAKDKYRIKRVPWFPPKDRSQYNWWTKPGSSDSYFMKTVLSFALNGWHFCKAVRVYFLMIPFAFLFCLEYNIAWYYGFLIALPSYALHGLVFEVFFEDLYLFFIEN